MAIHEGVLYIYDTLLSSLVPIPHSDLWESVIAYIPNILSSGSSVSWMPIPLFFWYLLCSFLFGTLFARILGLAYGTMGSTGATEIMPKRSLRTRSKKRRTLRLPGGHSVTHYKKEKITPQQCTRCGRKISGTRTLFRQKFASFLQAREKLNAPMETCCVLLVCRIC